MYAKTEFKNSLYKVMLYSLVIIVLDVAAIVLLQSHFNVDLGDPKHLPSFSFE